MSDAIEFGTLNADGPGGVPMSDPFEQMEHTTAINHLPASHKHLRECPTAKGSLNINGGTYCETCSYTSGVIEIEAIVRCECRSSGSPRVPTTHFRTTILKRDDITFTDLLGLLLDGKL